MKRRCLSLILLLTVSCLLVWLTIQKHYGGLVWVEREDETENSSRPPEIADVSRMNPEIETANLMSVYTDSLTERLRNQGQSNGTTVSAVTSADNQESHTATERSGTVTSTVKTIPSEAPSTVTAQPQGKAERRAGGTTTKENPDKFFSPYLLPVNETRACRKLRDHSIKVKTRITSDTKLILYWQEFGYYTERKGGFRYMCPLPTAGPCEITWDESYRTRADAVVFHASRLFAEKLPFKKRPGQIWIARALESPQHWRKAYRSRAWKGVFNWTFTYRPDSEFFSPIGAFFKLPDRPKADYRKIAIGKTKSAAWFVSDCNTDSNREKYVREMKKFIDVDVYGECGNLKCKKTDDYCFEMLSETYRFYLAFENSLCNYYVTEKFFNKFGSINTPRYIIPVVRGGTNYRKYFPEGTFIDAADFNSPKDLALYLKKLSTDHDAYAALIARKDQFRNENCMRSTPWCKLCDMLHDKNIKPKVYKDLGAWWDKEACVKPTDI